MSAIGRNEPCPCGSGKKAKRCCGARRGPSDAELAKAFLATRSREAAVRLVRHGLDEIHELFDEMLELPGRHLALQVQAETPRLPVPCSRPRLCWRAVQTHRRAPPRPAGAQGQRRG